MDKFVEELNQLVKDAKCLSDKLSQLTMQQKIIMDRMKDIKISIVKVWINQNLNSLLNCYPGNVTEICVVNNDDPELCQSELDVAFRVKDIDIFQGYDDYSDVDPFLILLNELKKTVNVGKYVRGSIVVSTIIWDHDQFSPKKWGTVTEIYSNDVLL